jgi:hypothetical protein
MQRHNKFICNKFNKEPSLQIRANICPAPYASVGAELSLSHTTRMARDLSQITSPGEDCLPATVLNSWVIFHGSEYLWGAPTRESRSDGGEQPEHQKEEMDWLAETV